ncbi:hypothetical protein BDV36DRAFT_299612 [Aspergillus pseudocaelatus]|uniref:N-acetyltransferase domain-containing protein n=1 Tax=Aspergillus pseudocaelatus TaxID=1825620 RepID=A0ABQ6W9M3_9EURO|nr:hypothetical protein BDV36DRAFT_299612 [Aspergillus pseudocaelatus]
MEGNCVVFGHNNRSNTCPKRGKRHQKACTSSEVGQDPVRVVVSFAKWRRLIDGFLARSYVEAPWQWPAGTRFDILEDWTRRFEAAASSPQYSWGLDLSYIATSPEHERRGTASMLVKWGVEQAKKDGMLAALESTKNGWPLYERLGFKAEGSITMELEEMGVLYEEMCFVWRP